MKEEGQIGNTTLAATLALLRTSKQKKRIAVVLLGGETFAVIDAILGPVHPCTRILRFKGQDRSRRHR
jgi:hypothetical protein